MEVRECPYVSCFALQSTSSGARDVSVIATLIPTTYEARQLGPEPPAGWLARRAPRYLEVILRGAKPDHLAIEQPPRYELAIDLKTASALGAAVPQSVLLRADRVVE